MSSTLDEAFFDDATSITRISSYLELLVPFIDELTTLMDGSIKGSFGPEGREHISPEAFYWEIRPWFNGGKWLYAGVGPNGEGKEMEWGGPSAGQSSLVHALDLFLGVDHAPRTNKETIPTTFVEKVAVAPSAPLHKLPLHKSPSDSTFMQRMSHYMPGHHRAFLLHLSSLHTRNPLSPSTPVLPSLRQLASTHPALTPSYDLAVEAMKRFRNTHIRLATFFIVQQARREPTKSSPHWPEWERKRLAKEAEEEEMRRKGEEVKKEAIAGTGGTDLVTFLKRCRDRTAEAKLAEV
jgi:indoleamine 2,3-dioxygenase